MIGAAMTTAMRVSAGGWMVGMVVRLLCFVRVNRFGGNNELSDSDMRGL